MRYGEDDRESENVEDRRGEGGGMFRGGGGGGIPFPIGGGGLSITSLLVIGAICLMLGINPLELLSGGEGMPRMPDMPRTSPRSGSPFEIPGGQQPRVAPQNDEMTRFVRRVLADTEDVWERVFQAAGKTLREADAGAVHAAPRRRRAAPASRRWGRSIARSTSKVYIDLDFYHELKDRFHAPGDFAQAYVIAHEVGHHVQTLLGVADKVQGLKQQAMQRGDEREVNGCRCAWSCRPTAWRACGRASTIR